MILNGTETFKNYPSKSRACGANIQDFAFDAIHVNQYISSMLATDKNNSEIPRPNFVAI